MNALKEIRKRETRYTGANVTRYYNAVVPTRNGECRIDTYAVKTRNRRTGELAVKKVARYYSDRERWTVRQCYAKFNQKPEKKIGAFAKLICDKAKAIYRKAA